MKFTVLGCGRWGSFIAWYLDRKGFDVCVFGRAGSDSFEVLKQKGENEYVKFPASIKLTNNLAEALNHADNIIISISSQQLRSFMQDVKSATDIKDKNFILCMKGIEEATGKRLSEVMTDSGVDPMNIAVWVGPGHIQDFTRNIPNVMVIDSANMELKKYLVKVLSSDLIKYYIGTDLIGTEIGAAAKNVMGIAAGMLDGAGFVTLKGPLMCRGAHEVSKLIKAMGGNEMSAYGLCHLGDYETTLFSPFSNNRKFGENFVKGVPFTKLAEGVKTAEAMLRMASQLKVELPITKAVHNIIVDGHNPIMELTGLFNRSNTKEFD